MDRRESLKSMFVGTLAGGLVVQGCAPEDKEVAAPAKTDQNGYGRTKEEKARDEKLLSEVFFQPHELETLAVLCDIILPSNAQFPSATAVGVPDFMEFIVKDLPYHQLPIRGGLMWLDNRSNKQFQKVFKACSIEQQKSICDEIAFPERKDPALQAGIKFFSLVRNLTLTGYYTTKEGIEDLGYKGNTTAIWDGVPQEVLDDLGLSYDEAWLAKCVDQSKRNEIAKWDDEGNLLS